jgi:hypothetical protein
VPWEVVGVIEFENWFLALDESSRARVEDRIDLLEHLGPSLGRPVVDLIKTSRHQNMKELQTGSLSGSCSSLTRHRPQSCSLAATNETTGLVDTKQRSRQPTISSMSISIQQRNEHGKTIL